MLDKLQKKAIDFLVRSPEVQKQIAQERDSFFAERQRKFSELKNMRDTLEKEVAAALKTEEKLTKVFKEAEAKYVAAWKPVERAKKDTRALDHKYQTAIFRLERELKADADNKSIDDFLAWLESRRADLKLHTDTALRSTFEGTEVVVTASNQASVERLATAIIDARRAAEGLRLYPGPDLDDQIQQLRDSLPVVRMEKVSPRRAAVAPVSA